MCPFLPFNLKEGGAGLWVFSESKYFFRFVAQRNFFKAYSAFRIFFMPMSETEFVLPSTEKCFPKKTHSHPPPPAFKLNGCFLRQQWYNSTGYLFVRYCTVDIRESDQSLFCQGNKTQLLTFCERSFIFNEISLYNNNGNFSFNFLILFYNIT